MPTRTRAEVDFSLDPLCFPVAINSLPASPAYPLFRCPYSALVFLHSCDPSNPHGLLQEGIQPYQKSNPHFPLNTSSSLEVKFKLSLLRIPRGHCSKLSVGLTVTPTSPPPVQYLRPGHNHGHRFELSKRALSTHCHVSVSFMPARLLPLGYHVQENKKSVSLFIFPRC